MRTSPRYYLIAEDDEILRLAQPTFYDILLQKKPTPFPQFRGHRVKLATLHVALDGRRPVAVARAAFNYITFDDHGLFDSTEWDKSFERVIETWDLPKLSADNTVIDARAQFVDRRAEAEETWIPSDELRERLIASAIGKRRPQPSVH
jgi:hypothetical protein